MRKNLIKTILGITCMACLFFTAYKPIIAQVYSQFQFVETRNWGGDFRLHDSLYRNGEEVCGPGHLPPTTSFNKFWILNDGIRMSPTGANGIGNAFRLYRNPTARPDDNLDDGYAEVDLGFTYRFNAKNYTKIYVSINGFVTFNEPPGNEAIARDTNCLFTNDVGGAIPTNVIAPYWGDHKYWPNTLAARDSGKAASEIGFVRFQYKTNAISGDSDVVRSAILIQWKNLNVNWCDRIKNPDGTVADSLVYLGNVASFQLIIYEGPDTTVAQQGDVEFRYGMFQPTEDQLISPGGSSITSNPKNKAAVGAKGDYRVSADKSDFINALYCGFLPTIYPADVEKQRNSATLATFWPPSGDPARAILLKGYYSINGDENWGDGDADMSKAEGGRHYVGTVPQNRYVTLGDVRAIMLATVTGRKLDSVYRQEAFHADVHHDGRFYYLTNRNSGIFRAIGNEAGTNVGDIILDNSLVAESFMSRDTFYVRKVGALQGKFGFLECYGQNDEYIEIDFVDFGIPSSQSVRRFRVVDRNNTAEGPDFDYQIRIVVLDDGINRYDVDTRTLLRNVSEDNVHNRVEVIRIKLKKHVVWRDSLLTQTISDLPGISNPYKEIYYEANELDASFIMAWLGGQITTLPYIYDNPDHNKKGKVITPFAAATNIAFNNEKVVDNNIVLPIYYNGFVDNNQSVKFNFNTNVVNIESANSNVLVNFSNDTKTAVIVSDGHFNPNSPIAYVTLANDVNKFEASDIRFYGEGVENVSYKLSAGSTFNNNSLSNTPNPAINFTKISVNIPVSGTYRLAIYDNSGNLISEIANSNFEVGPHNFTWDCEKVATGTYFYTLEGADISVTKSLVIAR